MAIRASTALAVLLVGCGVLGCGQPARPKYLRTEARFATLSEARDALSKELLDYIAAKDDRGIAHLLSSPMGYGGVWFLDTSCRRKFSGAGVIPESGIDQLASCLAALPLQPGSRAHPYPDVSVFQYEPGVEIEAMFDPGDGGHLVWMGFAGRRDQKDALPTVTEASLLALRNEVAPLVIDAATEQKIADEVAGHAAAARGEPVHTWFKVCIDVTGAVSGVHPRQTSSVVAQDVFAAWVKTWTFKPYLLGDQPTPVCSMIVVDHPAGAARDAVRPWPLPPELADNLVVTPGALGELLEGTATIVPDAASLPDAKGDVSLKATLLYCIDTIGKVDAAVVMRSSGIAAYDAKLVEGVKAWRFAPLTRDGVATAACSHAQFAFSQSKK